MLWYVYIKLVPRVDPVDVTAGHRQPICQQVSIGAIAAGKSRCDTHEQIRYMHLTAKMGGNNMASSLSDAAKVLTCTR